MPSLMHKLSDRLKGFRQQGQVLADINPISALADELGEQLYRGELSETDLAEALDEIGQALWEQQGNYLRVKTGLSAPQALPQESLTGLDFSKPLYTAVFTAHPVFAATHSATKALAEQAVGQTYDMPKEAYSPRASVSLWDEHKEAMDAASHARAATRHVTRDLLELSGRRDTLPQLLGIASWVGYDLDGRDDISWVDSFRLRLIEKQSALQSYCALSAPIPCLRDIHERLVHEYEATQQDVIRFDALAAGTIDFAEAANALTDRPNKLVHSISLAEEIFARLSKAQSDAEALDILVLAGDMARHGFGIGEIHLRVNAVQLRNAMRAVDGRAILQSGDHMSSHLLIEGLAERIRAEDKWQINFASLRDEMATARRQFMLATQILKHVDADQPIRFLIAECEQPTTMMSALYLAHKFGVADKIDLSPLFETNFGLEHGAKLIEQLLTTPTYRDYLLKRGRLAVQMGFSDAGRFLGQIAANLAIERLQIKIAQLVHEHFNNKMDLLLFNTHGESMGRGCARGDVQQRQNFILTPYVRRLCEGLGVHIQHQSSFQGGDGYRLFANAALAEATIRHLFIAERDHHDEAQAIDPFYERSDFSLDMFLSLKSWHERLFFDPHYIELLDMFDTNLLPISGSRPAKRVTQAGMGRRDPSKIRAIPHNAVLQQLGFLAHVISGFGGAVHVDSDRFAEIYPRSPRLQQLLRHVLHAKERGSLNTLSAYGRILDRSFWIDRAYHDYQPSNLRSYRRIGESLGESRRATATRHMVAKLRDDLIDLYRATRQIGETGVRVMGDDRILLDVLHAIRIALISEALVLVARVPRFSEASRNSNADVIRHALRLDFASAVAIIREEFSLDRGDGHEDRISEAENYRAANMTSYRAIDEKIISPLRSKQALIIRITQMVSACFDAHG